MAGDSILIRRKDVIAGKGIAIEPSGVSAAIRIINTEVDSERLLPVNPTVNDIPIYKQMDAEGNGEDVKLLIQSPATASQVADTAAGVVTHATVTAHGSLGVDDRGLLFDGNTYLEIDKNNVQSILTGSNPWCFDLYITGSEEVTSSYVQIGSLFTDNNDYVINWGMIDGKVNAVNIPAWGTIEGFTAGEPHLLTIEHYISAGASTIALYCDNVRRSVISNVIMPTVNENLWIGKGPVGYFKGWLDYIRIRNTTPYQSSTITPDPTPYLAAGERWTVINLSEIEGGGGTTPTDVDWNDIQNKPSTFPPSAHTHIISDVTGLSDVAVKAHTHENKITLDKFGEVNNKPTFNGEEIGSGVSSWNDLEDKPTTFPPSEHTHQIADVSGLQDSLDSKVSSVNGQTGAVTIPNASATEAGLMSAADKSKLDGIDTTGSTGDMLKSVYDTNNDGIVDHAAVADTIGTATATQVETAVSQSHTHTNKSVLDELGESGDSLTFKGTIIGSGGSGGGASSLSDLSDTDNIDNATAGQVLTYNSSTQKWEPADAAAAAGRDDITFTSADLTEASKLVISNCTVGGFAILDENQKQVLPDPQQVDGNVEVDFSGWTVTGTWTVKFITGGTNAAGTGVSVSWSDLIGKPSTFPPAAHTQDQSTINGLTDALAAKLDAPATEGTTGQVLKKTADGTQWSDESVVAESRLLPETTTDGDIPVYAVASNNWSTVNISTIATKTELSSYQLKSEAFSGAYTDLTNVPTTFPPAAHTQDQSTINGLTDALAAKLTTPTGGSTGQAITKTANGTAWTTVVLSVNGQTPSSSGAVTIPTATTSAAGLMSAADKTKLDTLSTASGTVTSVNGISPDGNGAVVLNAKTVASNESVNNTTDPGTYYVDSGASGLPLSGNSGGAYVMDVIHSTSGGYTAQRLTSIYNCGVQYMRTQPGNSASWRSWASPFDLISVGQRDTTQDYMSGWFWCTLGSDRPAGISASDTVLFAHLNTYNNTTYNVQLAFNYTNGAIYMRKHRSDIWKLMSVGAYASSGSIDMDANATVSTNVSGTYLFQPKSITATLDFSDWSTSDWESLTEPPTVYVSYKTFSGDSTGGTITFRFKVLNPPAKAYKINWVVAG